MMTFTDYMAMREGLWLADKNAVLGMSRVNPYPPAGSGRHPASPTPVKPPKPTVPKAPGVAPTKPTPNPRPLRPKNVAGR